MKISKLIWSKRVADKIRAKHNVLPQEVKEICGCFKVVTAREMDRKEKQFVKKRLGK